MRFTGDTGLGNSVDIKTYCRVFDLIQADVRPVLKASAAPRWFLHRSTATEASAGLSYPKVLLYLVLGVSQNPLHGPLSSSFDNLLDVVICCLNTGHVSKTILSIEGFNQVEVLLTGFSRRTVRSTTDTLGVGTRKAIPVSLLQEETNVSELFPNLASALCPHVCWS